MKWVVSTYLDTNKGKKSIKSAIFNNYEDAKNYYWMNKESERRMGKYLELKCYKDKNEIDKLTIEMIKNGYGLPKLHRQI